MKYAYRLVTLAIALLWAVATLADSNQLWLPEIYQSGMVLPRDRYITIRGKSVGDGNCCVKVAIDGRTYTAKPDANGDWHVTILPLSAGKTYAMKVTMCDEQVMIDDIAVGEVWLASGQSNMEFVLNNAVGGKETAAAADDADLRFFDMKPVAITNGKVWDAAAMEKVNNHEYFKPSRWQSANPDDAKQWSAIAYHFAKELRDSLSVPVGIICNAVGGSPTESWIDVATLQDNIPGILVDWRHNDYLQDWVQTRINDNTAPYGDAAHHPYEPGYLFSAGIRPLCQYPISGVIWYQGESNAHNVELHERLFPLLVGSWRRHYKNPDLPFLFVQLSSIDRPLWPEFRNSQRLMADRLPHMGMAVSSDLGDSLDVHPRDKQPVGSRLARIALHDCYGHAPLEYSGPRVEKAERLLNQAVLTMNHADGMRPSEGSELRSFEIAGADRVYYPAEAQIVDNQLILHSMNVKFPRYVRYAWQPFTRANLVNSDCLPASTFEVELDNAYDAPLEDGFEAGLSASYGLAFPGVYAPIIAGGCNFPSDPLAAGSQKKFYRGVYVYDTDCDCGKWKKIGDLPEPIAYGVYAYVEGGVALIGGVTPNGATGKAYLAILNPLTDPNQQTDVTLQELPDFPGTIDNAYASAIGNKIYVAGGNYNGVPSKALFVLDLADLSNGWQRLADMPGNPRVQPVMAVGRNAKGEECLYLWGGFAGKGDGREASLEVDGLCYAPSTGKWTALPAPTDENGNPVSLGGGVAIALQDGCIYTAGGVNKDVFLAALRNQPADYLMHPAEWYAFNQLVHRFDPATGKWSIVERNADNARAGAAVLPTEDAGLVLVGGEIKPRIRNPFVRYVHVPAKK